MDALIGLTPSMIMFLLGILGMIFTVFNYFRNPQISSDKNDVVISSELKALTEKLQLLINNDIHEIKNNMQNMRLEMTDIAVRMGKVETIIEERVPRRI